MCNSSISLFKVLTYFPLNIIRKAIHLPNVIWTVYSYSFHWCELMCHVYKILVTSQEHPLDSQLLCVFMENSTMRVNYFVFIPELDLYWLAHGIRHIHVVIFIKMLFIFVVVVFCCVYYFYFPCNLIQAYCTAMNFRLQFWV